MNNAASALISESPVHGKTRHFICNGFNFQRSKIIADFIGQYDTNLTIFLCQVIGRDSDILR